MVTVPKLVKEVKTDSPGGKGVDDQDRLGHQIG
jgi:hypothetical protein